MSEGILQREMSRECLGGFVRGIVFRGKFFYRSEISEGGGIIQVECPEKRPGICSVLYYF